MSRSFSVTAPLPARGSATALRQQLLEHLRRERPSVGERFHSDHELARIAQLSRPTVRRALDDLERDGWIERRPGIGTFIGPRAALGADESQVSPGNGNGHGQAQRANVRLALMIHMMGDMGHDWYAAGVMNGMDHAAGELGLSVELLGDRSGDFDAVRRRLQQNTPDVLAFAAPSLVHVGLIGAATAMNIPCIGTGTLLAHIGVPTVAEDSIEGAKLAVRYLVREGHQRIGMVLAPFPLPWVFQRRRGYVEGLVEEGIEPDERLVLWLPAKDDETRTSVMQAYLEREKPTALLLGSWGFAKALSPLVRSGHIRVPRDLSVVTFDQAPVVEMWLGAKPTTLALPLVEMGRRLAHMARDLKQDKPVEKVTKLPCELVAGESVARREG